MRKTMKIIAACLIAAAAVGIAARIVYVQLAYPSVKIKQLDVGDTIDTGDYLISISSALCYDKQEWEEYVEDQGEVLERYTYGDGVEDLAVLMTYDLDGDYKVIVVDVEVTNNTNEVREESMGRLCGINTPVRTMVVNYYYTKKLQPGGEIESMKVTLQPGETQRWRYYYTVDELCEKYFFEYIKVGDIQRIVLSF